MSLKKDPVGQRNPFTGLGRGGVISRLDLAKAIQRSFEVRKREGEMEGTVAQEMADHVLNFFGFGDRIIDNMLRTDDRDIFYMLEDLGILKTEREETTLYDGREWRINYWTMKRSYIESLIWGVTLSEEGVDVPDEDPYRDLPDELWKRE